MLLTLMLLSALAAGQDSRAQSMLPRLTKHMCGCPLPPVGEGIMHMTTEGTNLTEATPRCRRGASFYTCRVTVRIFDCQCTYQRWVPQPQAADDRSLNHGLYWKCTGGSCWYESWTATSRVPYTEVTEEYRGRAWRFRLPFDE